MSKFFLVLYSIFAVLFVIFSYLFVDTNLIYLKFLYTGFALSQRLVVSCLYILLILFFFSFYIYFLITGRKKGVTRNMFVATLLLSVIFILSYPAIVSYDIFNYLATAKVTFHFGENPYLVMPNEFIGDPMLLFTRAANKYALYGPVWIMLTGVPYMASLQDVVLQMFLFKVFVALFYFGLIYLMYKFTKSYYAVAFFALNPLVLLETFVSGHNDVVMMFFALFSFYLLKVNKKTASGILLVLSVLVKFATIVLLPVWIYMVFLKYKQRDINYDKMFSVCAFLLFVVLLLAPIREEIYPWYFIWVLSFVTLLKKKAFIKILCIIFSCGLLLSYVPYMYFGEYYILLKLVFIIVIPVIVTGICLLPSRIRSVWRP